MKNMLVLEGQNKIDIFQKEKYKSAIIISIIFISDFF